jgi:peptide/nickel transport system permease protein
VLTVLVVSILVFLLTTALGDPAAAILGPDARQPALLASTRAELGLDRSLAAQYADWLTGVLRGDLGTSYASGESVGGELAGRIVNSLVLMSCAVALAVPVSIVVGAYAALRRDRAFDTATNYVSLLLAGIPEFVLATILVVLFATGVVRILPAVSSVRGGTQPWEDIPGMVLPAVTLALVAVPYVLRSTRASMVEVLDSPYVRSAQLNGASPRLILWRHALPNAVGPTIQVLALSLGYLAGGAVVVEKVFNYPGIGSALVDAIAAHDVPMVQFIAVFITAVYVAVNTLADIVTVLVTPRLRTALP